MVKLTAQMIADSPQYTNPLRDREVDLRGYKLSVIENLGATLDQFDCIDLSDNDIKKLENFPLLRRLRMLILNNNRICRFESNMEQCLPQLETVVLTNNNVQELTDLEPLKTIKTLTNISFLRNPITTKQNYRLFVIHCLPQVRVLDFQRVKMKEREAAKKLFSGKKGELLKKDIAAKRSRTFEVKDVVSNKENKSTEEDQEFMQEKYKDQEAIKTAITNATTLEEVRKLELLLQQGHIPGKSVDKGEDNKEVVEVEEEEEEEEVAPMEKNNEDGDDIVETGTADSAMEEETEEEDAEEQKDAEEEKDGEEEDEPQEVEGEEEDEDEEMES